MQSEHLEAFYISVTPVTPITPSFTALCKFFIFHKILHNCKIYKKDGMYKKLGVTESQIK